MSSFFRSAADISESGDDSSRYDESSGYDSNSRRVHQQAVSRAPSDANLSTFQQNVLFASLLEEKCINDVREELNDASDSTYTKDHPTVQRLAAERYQVMSAQLQSHGLAPAGFEHDSLRQVRQRARDGLSMLSQNLQAMRLGEAEPDPASNRQALVKSAPMSRAVSQPNVADYQALGNAVNSLALSALSPPRQEVPHPLVASHPLIDSTRYVRDFEEVCMLGKGGYGTVHQCNHRLDGYSYAIKKIPLAPTVLYKVQQKGPAELNAILNELRTMARIDHPNIVRYYGGWIEWSTSHGHRPGPTRQQSLLVAPGVSESDSDSHADGIDFSPINTIDEESLRRSTEDENDNGILFEDSFSRQSKSSNKTLSDTRSLSNPRSGAGLQPVLTRGTVASVSDEEVEFVTRNDATTQSQSEEDTSNIHGPTGPSLTLHIQMSLYPLTLSEYLRAQSQEQTSSVQQFNHCFHLPSACKILLAVLSGVSYLHTQSIVHRDLKPANIFLHPQILAPNHDRPIGSVDPFACPDCPPRSPSSSKRLTSMKVCIGDFGLVSTIHAGPPTSPAKAVGTELYRPDLAHQPQIKTSINGSNSTALDVFSLGIIFCELLYQFQTRMERHEKLTRLRRWGELPDDFDGRIGSKAAIARSVVRAMLGFEPLQEKAKAAEDEETICMIVRKRVLSLLEGSAS